MTEVASIHIPTATAITEDGQTLPITSSFDEFGDDADLADAVVCVAGPDKDGKWLTIDFRHFEKMRIN
jgi:hypothetical protein